MHYVAKCLWKLGSSSNRVPKTYFSMTLPTYTGPAPRRSFLGWSGRTWVFVHRAQTQPHWTPLKHQLNLKPPHTTSITDHNYTPTSTKKLRRLELIITVKMEYIWNMIFIKHVWWSGVLMLLAVSWLIFGLHYFGDKNIAGLQIASFRAIWDTPLINKVNKYVP